MTDTPNQIKRLWHGRATVVENVPIACDTYRLRFGCPEIARRILPGQFMMFRLSGRNNPLLGRPLALYDLVDDESSRPGFVDVVYLVVGKMTRLLAQLQPGGVLEVWGPLGNGFPPSTVVGEHLIMVAGGIGQTPFLALAREVLGLRQYGEPPRLVPQAKKVTLCYGVRTQAYLACVEDFRHSGVKVLISTDDGTAGHCGPVTDLIQPVIEHSKLPCRIVCCGPEAMLAAMAAIAGKLSVPCQVSLESPMACGTGICFGCVRKIRDATGRWDYRRICTEGPVFDAEQVEFEETA